MKMSSEIKAFFIAPTILLVFPLILSVSQYAFHGFSWWEAVLYFIVGACSFLIFAYTLMLVFGLPLHSVLKKYSVVNWAAYIGAGVAAGITVSLIIYLIFIEVTVFSLSFWFYLFATFSGGLVAWLYWYIAVKHITSVVT